MVGLISNLDKEPETKANHVELEPSGTSLDLLQAIYRNPSLPLSTRKSAAAIAIQFEHPKLGVSVNLPWNDDFADRLTKAVERSSRVMKMIDQPTQTIEQTPQATVRGPVPDRRFRRA
jgi:hypothetical protein